MTFSLNGPTSGGVNMGNAPLDGFMGDVRVIYREQVAASSEMVKAIRKETEDGREIRSHVGEGNEKLKAFLKMLEDVPDDTKLSSITSLNQREVEKYIDTANSHLAGLHPLLIQRGMFLEESKLRKWELSKNTTIGEVKEIIKAMTALGSKFEGNNSSDLIMQRALSDLAAALKILIDSENFYSKLVQRSLEGLGRT